MEEMNSNIPDEDMIDLTELLRALFRRKWIIIGVTFLSGIIAVVYVLLQDKEYSTTTKIVYQLADGSSPVGNLGALAAMAGVSMGGGGSGGADFSKYMQDILHSDVFLSKIVEREWKVYEDREDTVTLKEFWELEPDTTEKHWERKLKKSMHERLQSKINYSMDKESGLVKITTLFNTPFLATEVNRFIVKELNNIILNKLRFKAREKREFIEKRLEEVKKELRKAENRLKSFRQNNRRVNSSPALMLRQERLIRNVEIKGTVYKELLKQYETSKIEEKKDVPVLDIIDPAQIPVNDNLSGKKVVLIAGFAGIFFGILAAMGVEFYSKYKDDIISIIKS